MNSYFESREQPTKNNISSFSSTKTELNANQTKLRACNLVSKYNQNESQKLSDINLNIHNEEKTTFTHNTQSYLREDNTQIYPNIHNSHHAM